MALSILLTQESCDLQCLLVNISTALILLAVCINCNHVFSGFLKVSDSP